MLFRKFANQMNNYEFCAQWVVDQDPDDSVRVLDYGCGAGHIVKELRKRNVNAFGCDVFYEGGDRSSLIEPELYDDGVIRRMAGDNIPFDDESFDFVVTNQVMEHVDDLDGVLAEIRRVLKPGGAVLSIFPDKGIWRECHCGIPFLHWFPKNSRFRVYYGAGFRALGFGHHGSYKNPMQWSRSFCIWLDKWTHYRKLREIHSTYGKYFEYLEHIEDYWLQVRLGDRKSLVAWLPVPVQRFVVGKLGSRVFIARKPV